MAVSTSAGLEEGRYTPFLAQARSGGNGVVGTLSGAWSASGNGTGGGVTLGITMKAIAFGFRALIVPTLTTIEDTLSSAALMRFIWSTAGNRRLRASGDITQAVLPTQVSSVNYGQVEAAGIMVEGIDRSARTVFQAIWPTNTNLKSYRLRMFAVVYDAEQLERNGEVNGLLEGIR
jgi:hypothetical protein